ncbi:transposase [bacterium]|nr:transposase [bacterium]RQV95545.1 MAG: hypothetical protein EH221_06130 [bacterium]
MTCAFNVFEFLRRYLQHVLLKGFVNVRYFGFLATKKRGQLQYIKERIGMRLSGKRLSYPVKPKKSNLKNAKSTWHQPHRLFGLVHPHVASGTTLLLSSVATLYR